MTVRAVLLVGLWMLGCTQSQPPVEARMSRPVEASDRPAPRNREYSWMSRETWWQRHRALLELEPQRKRRAKLVFLGDSIVEGWDDASWNESFGEYAPVRLGIGGDMTQQVLWRIQHGELEHLDPKVLVLLIGTNNLGNASDTPAEVERGVAAVVSVLRQKLPQTTLVVLGILPRDEPGAQLRLQVNETNARIARLDDAQKVRFLEIGESFLSPDGSIAVEIMADGLHPTARGYRVLARSLTPMLKPLLTVP